MENRMLLNDEIKEELEELKKLELGTEQYKVTVDGLTKLIDRSIEIEKFNLSNIEKNSKREFEEAQIEAQIADQKTKNIISIIGIAVPTIVTIWGTLVSINFERTGNFTTTAGRNFINKLFRK